MTELSPETKRLFEAARDAYSPSAQRVDALQAALQARIAAEAAAGGAATGGSALAIKAAIVLGLATAAVIGVGLLRGSVPAPVPAAPASAPPTAVAIERAPPPAVEAAGLAVEPAAAAVAPIEPAVPAGDVPVVTPSAVLKPVVSPRPTSTSPRRAARAQHAGVAAQPVPVQSAHPEPASAVGHDTTVAQREHEAAFAAPEPEREREPAAPVAVSRDALDAEIRLLRAARAALDNGAAERALSILDAHAERYPRGTLLQEQLATRALALCALDRAPAARAVLRELSLHSPSSPHLARLRSSCAWPVGR
jgi:hypothetical protein